MKRNKAVELYKFRILPLYLERVSFFSLYKNIDIFLRKFYVVNSYSS